MMLLLARAFIQNQIIAASRLMSEALEFVIEVGIDYGQSNFSCDPEWGGKSQFDAVGVVC
jgi:hypothetical protein